MKVSCARPEGAVAAVPRAIGDHAIIGDCRSAALVAKDGSIDWLCLPHFSSPSLFAAILDPEIGGSFGLAPTGAFTSGRRYVGMTAVLETRFETATGAARVTDAMIVGGSARNLEPRREIVRLVEGLAGSVTFDVRFRPRPDYARAAARARRCNDGWLFAWRDEVFLLRCDQPLEADAAGAGGTINVAAGERACLSLSYEKGEAAVLLPLGRSARERIAATIAWWEEWARDCGCAGPHRDAVLRSAITLKLMTFALSGAVVAAPTTSLPEWIGAGRNWDYRYCWLRDAALTMRAFIGLGLRQEAGAFLRWLLHATALTRPQLRVMYDVFGRSRLAECELDHLDGYAGSRPVRIGNGAYDQLQLDVYGGVIAAAAEYVDGGGRLQRDQVALLAGFADVVCGLWAEPDHGIWEMRGARRQFTFSKLMCWVAIDRLLALDRAEKLGIDAPRLERTRASIAEAIESRGYNDAVGSYASELGGDRVDASLLLMPSLGYRDAGDPRHAATFARTEARLGQGGLFYRYEPDYDGERSPEGAFGICSFWAVENLARRGRVEQAEHYFARLLEAANDVGLYAEEIEPRTGAALGNFPQAFTHVGLINAALAIELARASRRDAA